jgi:hypothetical protein
MYLIINYPPIIVFPTIFFALGTSIHLFSEKGLRFRKIVIGLLILVFVGDLLLAYQVHSAVNEILVKANREEFKSLIVPWLWGVRHLERHLLFITGRMGKA